MFEIDVEREENFSMVTLKGALDSQVAADFETWFEEQVNSGYKIFALDMQHTKYLSSMGIGALIKVKKIH